jgi:ribonuclease P protein component
MARASFPRCARVRARSEFTRVFDAGKRVAHPALGLHWLRDDAPPRLGLAVSRKVDRRAVGRNRIKRLLRDEFRMLRARLPMGAYVIVARAGAATLDAAQLRAVFCSLLQRSGALPPSGPPGTMPPASDR